MKSAKTVIFVGFSFLIPSITCFAKLPPTPLLDQVYFGNKASEAAHDIQPEIAPLIRGGANQTARIVQLEGGLSFTLKCDPIKPNLVTLRLWGGDVKGEVKTNSGSTVKMEADKVRVNVDGKELSSQNEESLSDKPLFPGRFIYRTVVLPLEATAGKEEVTLTIRPASESGGAYAKVGGPAAKQAPKGSYSRGIYAAYLHTQNIFVPPANIAFGAIPGNGDMSLAVRAPPAKPLNLEAMRSNLIRAVDEAVAELKRRQLFGNDYENARDELGIPKKIDGLFDWTGAETFVGRGRKAGWEPNSPKWLVPVTGSASGRPHSSAGHLYMAMYREPGSRFFEDNEMVQRTVALLDGYCRYQGADGGWEIGGGSPGWVGGPDRRRASGGLPGYFAGGLALSFIGVLPELEKNPEFLSEMIDNNGDGEKSVTREEAYTQVFRDWLWKDYPRLSLRTGCANQDIHTALAAWRVNECLKVLAPEEAFPDSFFKSAFRQCMGIMPREADFEAFVLNITDKVDRGGNGDQLLISPGGVTMEWGFAPGYGQMQGAFAEMCEITEDPLLVEQYNRFLNAIQHFFIPLNADGQAQWMVESAIGSRNTQAGFKPGNWSEFAYAANEMQNPVAQRIMRFGLEQTDNFSEISHGRKDRMHLTSESIRTLETLNGIEQFHTFWEQPISDYRLPTERTEPCVWTDPTSSARIIDPIFINEGDGELLYIQWNLYQLISDRYLSYGSTQVVEYDDFVQGQFGPYYTAINRAKTGGDDVNRTGGPRIFVPPFEMTAAKDLLSEKAIDLSSPSIMQNGTAYLFDLRELAPQMEKEPQAKVDFISETIDRATDRVAWRWKITASETGLNQKDQIILSVPESLQMQQVLQSYLSGGNVFEAIAWEFQSEPFPTTIETVNVQSRLLAISGLSVKPNTEIAIQVIGQIPSFTTYEAWEFKNEGTEADAKRAAFAELSNGEALKWKVLNAKEERNAQDSTVQRTREAMQYTYKLDAPVSAIAFDYAAKGAERLPIQLIDGNGTVLWENRNAKATNGRIELKDVYAKQELTFRVEVHNDHIYPDFFHSVTNLRLKTKL